MNKVCFQHNIGLLLTLVATLTQCTALGQLTLNYLIVSDKFVGLQIHLFNDINIYKMFKCSNLLVHMHYYKLHLQLDLLLLMRKHC